MRKCPLRLHDIVKVKTSLHLSNCQILWGNFEVVDTKQEDGIHHNKITNTPQAISSELRLTYKPCPQSQMQSQNKMEF